MSKYSLHKRLIEIDSVEHREFPLQGNRRLATLNAEHFDEVNGERLFFYTRRLVGLANGQLIHAAAK